MTIDDRPAPSWEPTSDATSVIEENWLFRLRRDRYRSRASGRCHDFYVMELPDAVNVVAVTPDRRVVLVRQFRAGSNRDSLEPPGGLLDPGEDERIAGARELLEETGYAGGPGRVLGRAWANPSILSSRIITLLIEDVVRVAEPRLDASEEVAVELHPREAIEEMLASGAIDHALGVCGLALWLLHERR